MKHLVHILTLMPIALARLQRIILTYALTFLLSSHFSAQTDSSSTKKAKNGGYELGMNLYTLGVNGGDFYSGYKHKLDNFVFNGLYLKIYFHKNVWRFSGNYFQKLINLQDRTDSKDPSLLSSKSLQLTMGYQRMLGKGKHRITPYLSMDLAYDLKKELRMLDTPFSLYDDYIGNVNSFTTTSLFSLSPGVGLRISLGKNLTLNLESNVQFFYGLERSNYQPETNKMVGLTIHPLQCGLGFQF